MLKADLFGHEISRPFSNARLRNDARLRSEALNRHAISPSALFCIDVDKSSFVSPWASYDLPCNALGRSFYIGRVKVHCLCTAEESSIILP